MLVKHGIHAFAKLQEPACKIDMHVLAHSMGAYVVREAFDDADDTADIAQKIGPLARLCWSARMYRLPRCLRVTRNHLHYIGIVCD